MEPNKDESNYNWQYSIKPGDILLHQEPNLLTNDISKYVVVESINDDEEVFNIWYKEGDKNNNSHGSHILRICYR